MTPSNTMVVGRLASILCIVSFGRLTKGSSFQPISEYDDNHSLDAPIAIEVLSMMLLKELVDGREPGELTGEEVDLSDTQLEATARVLDWRRVRILTSIVPSVADRVTESMSPGIELIPEVDRDGIMSFVYKWITESALSRLGTTSSRLLREIRRNPSRAAVEWLHRISASEIPALIPALFQYVILSESELESLLSSRAMAETVYLNLRPFEKMAALYSVYEATAHYFTEKDFYNCMTHSPSRSVALLSIAKASLEEENFLKRYLPGSVNIIDDYRDATSTFSKFHFFEQLADRLDREIFTVE
jgi:hypothetical protein